MPLSDHPLAAAAIRISGFSLSRYNSGHHRALLQVENFPPYFPAREGWKKLEVTTPLPRAPCQTQLEGEKQQLEEATGPGSPSRPPPTREIDWGISLAMPQCLLWICLAVWEAGGDLPFIAENDAALTVNW